MAAAVTKTYLESVGGGLKEFATNFINKVNAGEDATEEGCSWPDRCRAQVALLAMSLVGIQQMGRAVRTQGFDSEAKAFGGVDDREFRQRC